MQVYIYNGCRPHPVRVKKRPPSCVNFGGFQAHSKTGWFSWVFTHPKTFRHGRFSSGAAVLPEPRAARNSAFAYHSLHLHGRHTKRDGGRERGASPAKKEGERGYEAEPHPLCSRGSVCMHLASRVLPHGSRACRSEYNSTDGGRADSFRLICEVRCGLH